MDCSVVNPLSSGDWDKEVLLHPDGGFFHTGIWARVLHSTYGHEPHYFRFTQEGRLAALVPMMEVSSRLTGKRGVSVPFADECPPLVFDDSSRQEILHQVSRVARERKWRYMEFRGGNLQEEEAMPSVEFYTHTLDLSGGIERTFTSLDGSARNAVRKAERSNVTVEVSRDRGAVDEFYALHCQTRRKHGLPPQGAHFFSRIFEEVVRAAHGFVVLARHGERAIAASVFFRFGAKALYKYGAADEDYQSFRGSNAVMWHAIKHLTESGCLSLNYGRTSLSNQGLRRFKLGWDTKESLLKYFKRDTYSGKWLADPDRASGIHNTIFRQLPVVINRALGTLLYQHLD